MWAEPLNLDNLSDLAQAYVPTRDIVWLDSTSHPDRLGRYSYLCVDPIERLPNALSPAELRERLSLYQPTRLKDGPPFQGGLVGYFTYDYGRILQAMEPTAASDLIPNYYLGIYDTLVALDHQSGAAWVMSAGLSQEDPRPNQARAQTAVQQIQDDVISLARRGTKPVTLDWQADTSQVDYIAAIERTREFIREGDIYQANIAQSFSSVLPAHVTPLDLYLNIRQSNPAPFSGFVSHDNFAIACTSPERLIQLYPSGHVEARPIKGTIQRSADRAKDAQLKLALENSAKDRAENVMIVDLLRNDLSQICAPFSVKVDELCRLESYAGLHQLTSAIEGVLETGRDGFDLFQAVFPGGSITGAPKLRAMEIIHELERRNRRAFCGSLGYFGFDGAMDFNIMIRTVQVEGCAARLDAGGGITLLSDPIAEYEETLLKAQRIRAGTCDGTVLI